MNVLRDGFYTSAACHTVSEPLSSRVLLISKGGKYYTNSSKRYKKQVQTLRAMEKFLVSPSEEVKLFSILNNSYYEMEKIGSLHLIAMEYGPEPEDWKFWFLDPTDQFVGEFWDMVGSPERFILKA